MFCFIAEFGFTSKEGWNTTFREIYAKSKKKIFVCMGRYSENHKYITGTNMYALANSVDQAVQMSF